MPWIALVPDISGVCSVFGTFEITANPTNAASTRIARSVTRLFICPPHLRLAAGAASAAALAASWTISPSARDAGAGDHLVVEVERQLALVGDHQTEQRLDVARVQL